MSIRDSIRPIFPPTLRAFMNQMDLLSNQLTELGSQLSQSNQSLITLQKEVQSLKAENTYLKNTVDALFKRSKYVNLEYGLTDSVDNSSILIAGWYGASNFGDELMLRTLINAFPSEALSRITVLIWDDYSYQRSSISPEVSVLHYPNCMWDLSWLADHFDTLVWGGGAIIDELQYNDDIENYNTGNIFIRLSKMMLEKGKSVFCLGLSSIDSLVNRSYIQELRYIVEGSKIFSLRDPFSRETLIRSGIPEESISLCEDIAFANEDLPKLPKYVQNYSNDLIKVGLVALTSESLQQHYLQLLERLLSFTYKDKQVDITLIPFLNENSHDTYYYQQLINMLSQNACIKIAPYSSSLEDLHFENFDLVISYKYHSALISLVQEVSTICVVDEMHPHYGNKMKHLARLFGNEKRLVNADSFLTALESLIEDALTEESSCTIDKAAIENIFEHEEVTLKNECLAISQ